MAANNVAGINDETVTPWLSERLATIKPPLEFELIAGGHSNLTFCCTDQNQRRYILRRPPLGHVLPSAHDMAREHRIIHALQSSAVPLPATLALCEDPQVNGASFYVMDFVDGTVLHDHEVAAGMPMSERAALGAQVCDVLAALHRINPADVGLDDLGRHDAYLERQLKRWSKQWAATTTHPVPAMDASRALLNERMPAQIGVSIVHGDYRLGNFIVAEGELRAVLDWELCTLGDAMADIAYLLNTWVSPENLINGIDDHMPTMAGGFDSREAMAARYAAQSGRDLSAINYYRAFAYWRIAAIRQGVYKRYVEGAMGDSEALDLEKFKHGVSLCAEAALELLESAA